MSEIPRGAIRFNTDSNKVEVWNGSVWGEMQLSTPNLGRGVDTEPGARGLFLGGEAPANISGIDALNIATFGSCFEFGDLSSARDYTGSAASKTLVATAGGTNSDNTIDKTIFASEGTSTDYGDLSSGRYGLDACSNGTRGVFIGGFIAPSPNAPVNTMDYITITEGGTAQDFGSLRDSKNYMGAVSSNVRGCWAGGTPVGSPFSPLTGLIDYITIATTGADQDFGSLVEANRSGVHGASNATKGLFAGGYTPSNTNIIEYIIIATRGNATDYGDLVTLTANPGSGAASPTRAVFAGGTPSHSTNMDAVNIVTNGNAVDFGDLNESRTCCSGASNAHGGL